MHRTWLAACVSIAILVGCQPAEIDKAKRLISDPHPFDIDVDFTGRIRAAVQTPGLGGLQLLGDSGRDYFFAPVPVPAGAWLLGSARGLMGVMRRKISS